MLGLGHGISCSVCLGVCLVAFCRDEMPLLTVACVSACGLGFVDYGADNGEVKMKVFTKWYS